jgi:hypothetical protein
MQQNGMRSAYQIVDADTHILEPPDIWKKHLPKQYQKYAPKLRRDHDGGDAWDHGTGSLDPIGLVTTPGKRYEDFKWFGVKYSEARKACYNGAARIKDMDIEGVDAIVTFPPERTIFRSRSTSSRRPTARASSRCTRSPASASMSPCST